MKGYASKEMRRFNYLIVETDAVYHEAALKLGLSDSALQILYTVCDYDGGDACPLQEISRRTGISKQTINSAIRKLEGEGAVQLETARGRSKNVRLTPKGLELAQRTVIPMMKLEDEIYASWAEEELRGYLELTERFAAALKEKMKKL